MLTKRPQLIHKLIPQEWLLNSPPNVWMGITAEDPHWLAIRWPFLREIRADVHWLSVEPLFERIVLPDDFLSLGKRAWVVCGGQSGDGAVAMNIEWVRYLRDQCIEAGVPFYFKQWGYYNSELVHIYAKVPEQRLLDGREWSEHPVPGVDK
jgi:protein gp37